ncbi:histone-lysine N-methyltransferase SETMAR [Trichonephila clavipes]|nr:histone-lysine N-methyltransferase SETMAR [Trichonephila clavipes]
MDVSKGLVRGCLLYDSQVDLSAAASSRRICQAFGDLDDEALQVAIEEDSSDTCELARQFNTSSEAVRLHLHLLDYHLFHCLNIHLCGKSFNNEADVRQEALTDFFVSHTPEFYRKGIELETRWQKVLDADGDYFED